MTTLRQFCLDDLLRFNNINLDVLTETYNGKKVLARELERRAHGPASCHLMGLVQRLTVFHLLVCHRFLLHVLSLSMAGILYW